MQIPPPAGTPFKKGKINSKMQFRNSKYFNKKTSFEAAGEQSLIADL